VDDGDAQHRDDVRAAPARDARDDVRVPPPRRGVDARDDDVRCVRVRVVVVV